MSEQRLRVDRGLQAVETHAGPVATVDRADRQIAEALDGCHSCFSTCHTWEEGTLIEESPLSGRPVGASVRHSVVNWRGRT